MARSRAAAAAASSKAADNKARVSKLNEAAQPAPAERKGEWTGSKAALPGTYVADAIKGRPANGAGEYRQVAANEMHGSMRMVRFTDGTGRSMGAATKVFVAPADEAPDAEPVGKPTAAQAKAHTTAKARKEAELQADPEPMATPSAATSGPDAAPATCELNGRKGKDGRLGTTCGTLVNPAGYCCGCGAQLAQPGGRVPLASPASTGLYAEVADVPTDNPEATADADPARRYQLAKAEWAALRAWATAGRTPPRPATPNLDELEAEHAAAASGQSRKAAKPRANRPAIGALPVGATEGTCTGTCGQVLPATKFPKAVVDGKRQANQRASECRACRDGRRAAAKGSAEVAA